MEHQPVDVSRAELRSADPYRTSLDEDYNWGPNQFFQANGACTQTPAIAAEFQAVFDLEAEIQTKEVRQEREAQEALAKAICQGCGVLEECFEYVIPRNKKLFPYGVYSGLSSRERKKLVKEHEKDENSPFAQIELEVIKVRGRERGTMQSANPAA